MHFDLYIAQEKLQHLIPDLTREYLRYRKVLEQFDLAREQEAKSISEEYKKQNSSSKANRLTLQDHRYLEQLQRKLDIKTALTELKVQLDSYQMLFSARQSLNGYYKLRAELQKF